MRILLDLDCVLADFVGGLARLHGLAPEFLLSYWKAGEYPVNTALATALAALGSRPRDQLTMTDDEFWQPINRNAGFWAGLEPLPWFDPLVRFAGHEVGVANVHVVTAPSWCETSYHGKIAWIKAHFGHRFNQFVITPHKELFAKPDHVLIDDNETNVTQFRANGGRAIMFPVHHNALHARQHDPLTYVKEQF